MAEKEKKILFRVDAGAGVGLGHLVRCRALADCISKAAKACVLFVMSGEEFAPALRKNGFEFATVDAGAERLAEKFRPSASVVDLPDGAEEFLAPMRAAGAMTVVIDDLGGKAFDCDVLVNGTVVEEFRRYPDGVAKKTLLGPKYMILREEFVNAAGPRYVGSNVGSIFVALGGEDPHGVIRAVIGALKKIRFGGKVVIALGVRRTADGAEEIEEAAKSLQCGCEILRGADGIAAAMRSCDVAVVNAGMTLYEAACAGTPALAVSMDDWQWREAKEFARRGAVLNMGMWEVADEEWIGEQLQRLIFDRDLRARMSAAGPEIVDGRGVLRVAEEMLL